MIKKHIPYVDLISQHSSIKELILTAVEEVLDHGQFVNGEETTAFEKAFTQLCEVQFAVGVNSGTDGLILALHALGVGFGDEVITSPNSFVASSSCISWVGARPVFVDVKEDYNMDPTQIEDKITPRTKAILPIHLTGRPAEMKMILEIAERHNLYVIEGCSQAVSAEYYSKRVGSFGAISVFPLKTLNACGDSGIITTDDVDIYEELLLLRNHGLRSRDDCVTWGFNSRLDSVQAAILLIKMDYLDLWTNKRISNAKYYQKELSEVDAIKLPKDKPYEKAVYHTFVIEIDNRDALRSYLLEHGIETSVHYPVPIHLQAAAKDLGYKRGDFPVTEKQSERILSLPVHQNLQDDDLDHVVKTIKAFYN
ncbi:MAG: DegT/DnrJ/EryC1/StrS family aminotransferase [Candidatus Poribacteria bacterium]|nr:DegT/DnrJ/EryC1/StrS family aminotransferase [Candidatus Poribacteria bacterium]